MGVRQTSEHEVNLFLSLTSTGATGIVFDDVTVAIKKQNESSFTNKVLATEDWVEIGDGFYALKFSTTDTNTVGELLFTVSGADFDNFEFDKFLIEAVPVGVDQIPADTCLIQGNVRDIGGDAAVDHRVFIRPADIPAQSGDTILSSIPKISHTDNLGNFNVALLRNQIVLIDVNNTGVKIQFTVPDQVSALLTDLLP